MNNCSETSCKCFQKDECCNNILKYNKSHNDNDKPYYYMEIKPQCDFDGDCGNCYGCSKGVQIIPLNK